MSAPALLPAVVDGPKGIARPAAAPVRPSAPPRALPTTRGPRPMPSNLPHVSDGDLPASDPDASVVRWIPLVVPLVGAMMACMFYLIGYFVLIP